MTERDLNSKKREAIRKLGWDYVIPINNRSHDEILQLARQLDMVIDHDYWIVKNKGYGWIACFKEPNNELRFSREMAKQDIENLFRRIMAQKPGCDNRLRPF